MLRTLQSTLNFTYVIKKPKDNVFGSLSSNGSWSGIIGDLKNKKADIGLSDLSVTQQRADAVDFTTGLYRSSNYLYMKNPRRSVSWTTFTDVFDNFFMVLLAIEFFALAIVFFVIFYFVNNETTIGIGTSVSTVFLSSLALGIPVNPIRIPGRILVLNVCVTGALIFWSWNAGLISLLTTELFNFPITSLKVRF